METKSEFVLKSESAKVLQTLQSGLFEIKNQSHWAYKIFVVFEQSIGMPKTSLGRVKLWRSEFCV